MSEKRFIRRNEKVSFMKLTTGDYSRMKFFKAIEEDKNTREYSRVYVDESFERVDVIGISSSLSFTMDERSNDEVHKVIIDIFENEKLGDDAVIEVLSVDFSKPVEEGDSVPVGNLGYKAKSRSFVVIPENQGGEADAYSYSGTLRSRGNSINGVALFTDIDLQDNLENCTFVPTV